MKKVPSRFCISAPGWPSNHQWVRVTNQSISLFIGVWSGIVPSLSSFDANYAFRAKYRLQRAHDPCFFVSWLALCNPLSQKCDISSEIVYAWMLVFEMGKSHWTALTRRRFFLTPWKTKTTPHNPRSTSRIAYMYTGCSLRSGVHNGRQNDNFDESLMGVFCWNDQVLQGHHYWWQSWYQ